MTGTIGRGVVAGAVGTMLLNAATYLDMALTGRPASRVPGEAVERVAAATGLPLRRDESRLEAYGALGGMAVGVALGVVASVTRSAGVRLPAPVGAAATGALAMAATDVPLARTGISDPRSWTAADWARDAVPHLAYGAGVRWTLDRFEPAEQGEAGRPRPVRSRRGLLARSLALGLAAGSRSSLALGGPMAAAQGGKPAAAAAGVVGAEMVADKLPVTPSRLRPGPLGVRLAAGGAGAAVLARRDSAGVALPAIAGVAGAAVGSVAGAAWRDIAARRGWTWQAGAAEDGVALALAVLASR